MDRRWFDGHLDLASLVERGRDMHETLERCRGTLLPAAVTLPSLRAGRVEACLGTIFTQAVPSGRPVEQAYAYELGNTLAAWKCGMRQLKLYQAWARAGVIELMPRRGQPVAAAVGEVQPREAGAPDPIRLGILMECADPIESPDEVRPWVDGGLVAVGLAWWHATRYAGGNGSKNEGLTDLGRPMIDALDSAGVVHDVTHLSQRSLDELLAHTKAAVIASHSNCRALLPGDDHRHIPDEAIREIARRGGMIGVNLVRNFLSPALAAAGEKPVAGEATVSQVCDHIEHICAVAGDRSHVGLGSDMDGGITADDLPSGIRTPSDLHLITDELSRRGWSGAEVEGFAWGNWAAFWGVGSVSG